MIDLDELEDLFDDLSIDGPTSEQLYQLYGIFLEDFKRKPIFINGFQLRYNGKPSRHPICRGKALTFEHIITRESKYSGRRNFDNERANKIHWIKPIIENVDDFRIKYFEEINHDGENQLFFWYESRDFVVIVREIQPDYILITAYSVDKNERGRLKNKYEFYRRSKKNPTS